MDHTLVIASKTLETSHLKSPINNTFTDFVNRKDTDGDPVFSKTTQGSYIKEYRRLLVFCSLKHKDILSLNHEDTQDYISFLKNPPSHLISNKKLPATHEDWAPFNTQLSGSSIRQAIAPLKSFWTYLTRIGYISINPWALLYTKTNKVRNESALRRLRVVPTDLVIEALSFLKESEPTRQLSRQRWLFTMYLYTGSRLSDITKHTTDSFQLNSLKSKTFWVFNHRSKGDVFHSTPIPKVLIEELKRYRLSLGKPDFPLEPEPLVFNLTGNNALLHRSTIHNEMKRLFKAISKHIANKKGAEYASVFEKASTHWLKHSFVSIALDVSNGDIRSVTDLARHADWKTTKQYDHTDLIPLSNISDSIGDALNS